VRVGKTRWQTKGVVSLQRRSELIVGGRDWDNRKDDFSGSSIQSKKIKNLVDQVMFEKGKNAAKSRRELHILPSIRAGVGRKEALIEKKHRQETPPEEKKEMLARCIDINIGGNISNRYGATLRQEKY